jgi:hypothetical protein
LPLLPFALFEGKMAGQSQQHVVLTLIIGTLALCRLAMFIIPSFRVTNSAISFPLQNICPPPGRNVAKHPPKAPFLFLSPLLLSISLLFLLPASLLPAVPLIPIPTLEFLPFDLAK